MSSNESASEASDAGPDVEDLCGAFLHESASARIWAQEYPDVEVDDSDVDCDVISREFIRFLAEHHNVDAELVAVEAVDHPFVGAHWFVNINGTAVDWTARQFYNHAADREEWVDPTSIPCPLLFPWPSDYPIAGINFTPVDQVEEESAPAAGTHDTFTTLTVVVRGQVDEPNGVLVVSDELMFWAGEPGITQRALDLGADPDLWDGPEDPK